MRSHSDTERNLTIQRLQRPEAVYLLPWSDRALDLVPRHWLFLCIAFTASQGSLSASLVKEVAWQEKGRLPSGLDIAMTLCVASFFIYFFKETM